MSLANVKLHSRNEELPSEIGELLLEAERRVNLFLNARPKPVIGFVPSCYTAVYHALEQIKIGNLAPGDKFCEWGSGFGVTASMAAMLGFDAYGIEIDSELCDASRDLADMFDIPVQFFDGSFIPSGSDSMIDKAYSHFEGDLMLSTHSDNTYDELGLDVCDFDIVFAYPGPKDGRLTSAIFDKFASSDALLLTYNGLESMRLQRKVR